jgi:hypothetical protein
MAIAGGNLSMATALGSVKTLFSIAKGAAIN